MAKTKGVKTFKDGSMIVHPDIIGDSIKIPQVDTAYGAGFGDSITDNDRVFAACREPIGYFLTCIVARDMVDKWFRVDDPDTEEADPALDRNVQGALSKLKFKKRLREALESSRTFGKALLVGGFNDAKNTSMLQLPLKKGSELLQLAVYPSIHKERKIKQWSVWQKDENTESSRFGQPILYKLNRGGGSELIIHYTRVVEVGDGTSVLDKVWDDMCCGRNIRWGAAQWMYRTGGGFPVVGFPAGTTATQLEAYHNSGGFSNLMSRTAIFVAQNSKTENDGMTFTFEGASGRALDPQPFFKSNIEQIAIATGYPQAKLIGAQAGAVTGSEVNQQEYYKAISRDQEEVEYVVRWVVDHLADSGQLSIIKAVTDKTGGYHVNLLKSMLKRVIHRDYRHKTAENYIIEWNSAFELSEVDEADVELRKAQANQAKLDYMTVDEVRAEENLDPLPNGEGATLRKAQPQMFENTREGDSYLVTEVNKRSESSRRGETEAN
jgi:hypothetical protein